MSSGKDESRRADSGSKEGKQHRNASKKGAHTGEGKGRGRSRGKQPGKPHGKKDFVHPLEAAVRSTYNAVRRSANELKDEQVRLANRGLLTALHASAKDAANPGEILLLAEQLYQNLHSVRREDTQLPVTMRAVVSFALDTPVRQRKAQEVIRLSLRHLYTLSADFIPRMSRDDGRFRASAMLNVIDDMAKLYLDDESFNRLKQ